MYNLLNRLLPIILIIGLALAAILSVAWHFTEK